MNDRQIITGDSLELQPTLEGGLVRLGFADPPFNQGLNYGPHHNDRMSPADYLAWSARWIAEIPRLLTDDGSFWLMLPWEWAWDLVPIVRSTGLLLKQTVVWRETFGVNCTGKLNRCSRPLLWFVKDRKRFIFNAEDPEIRQLSARYAVYGDKRCKRPDKVRDGVWQIPRVAGSHKERIKGVPTQLPLALLRLIIACASEPGDLVLDPFAGSGTSGEACTEFGRRYIGIEASERYAELAQNRLRQTTPPLTGLQWPSQASDRIAERPIYRPDGRARLRGSQETGIKR
jgi:DNA modification methylase